MKTENNAFFHIVSLVLMAVCGAVTYTSAVAQDWDPAERAASPEAWAKTLLAAYDLVAVGEFDPDFVASVEDAATRQNLAITFRVQRVYKGRVSSDSSIAVEVISDMLVYPGESVSRYAWRLNYQVENARAVTATASQLAELDRRFDDGAISSREYDAERERLNEFLEHHLAAELPVPMRAHFSIHGQSFYDMDGVIRPNAEYLVGLDRIPNETESYKLAESPHSEGKPRSIYWGEMAKDILDALDRMVADTD